MILILCLLSIASISAQIESQLMMTGYWTNRSFRNCTEGPEPSVNWPNFYYIALPDADQSTDSDDSDVFLVSYGVSDISNYNVNYTQISTARYNWQSPDGTAILSYTTDRTTYKPTLVAKYSYMDTFCYYTFAKNLTQVTGVWYIDWQSGNPDSDPITSIKISSGSSDMTIYANTSNSSREGYFYLAATQNMSGLIYEGLGYWLYSPDTDTFYNQETSLTYSRNGSYQTPSAFLGTWVDPQFDEDYERAYCCVPYQINISNTSKYPSQLLAQLYFNETVLQRSDCDNFVFYETSDYVPLDISDSDPSEFAYLRYSSMDNSDIGSYTFSMELTSQPTLSVRGNWGPCGFTMTQTSGPNPGPKFADLLSGQIMLMSLLFGLIGIY